MYINYMHAIIMYYCSVWYSMHVCVNLGTYVYAPSSTSVWYCMWVYMDVWLTIESHSWMLSDFQSTLGIRSRIQQISNLYVVCSYYNYLVYKTWVISSHQLNLYLPAHYKFLACSRQLETQFQSLASLRCLWTAPHTWLEQYLERERVRKWEREL